jgi:hypothetical protein
MIYCIMTRQYQFHLVHWQKVSTWYCSTIFRKDGWWLAEDASGNIGVVPKTLVEVRYITLQQLHWNCRHFFKWATMFYCFTFHREYQIHQRQNLELRRQQLKVSNHDPKFIFSVFFRELHTVHIPWLFFQQQLSAKLKWKSPEGILLWLRFAKITWMQTGTTVWNRGNNSLKLTQLSLHGRYK